jgi:hypothetical protein
MLRERSVWEGSATCKPIIFESHHFSSRLWITFLAQLLGVFSRGMLSVLISSTRSITVVDIGISLRRHRWLHVG